MAKLFNLRILTPERQFFKGQVESLTVTTMDGRYSFLADHIPTVMPLVVGTLDIKTGNEAMTVFNSEGFLEVRHDNVMVYVQACESPEEIDNRRAEEAKMRAEERLRQQQSMQEYKQSKLAVARAMARLRVSRSGRGSNARPPL